MKPLINGELEKKKTQQSSLSSFTTEELQAELERRRNQQAV
jgi:hypothetical protein